MDNTHHPTPDEADDTPPQRAGAPALSKKVKQAYARAGREILEKDMNPACWAMAVDHAAGDNELARSYYARWRVEELIEELDETEDKKGLLDDRRISSFNRVRKMPRPDIIPAALRPTYGSLYWETLITIALMCSFIPFVLRFTPVGPIYALVYTLCASIAIVIALRIGARVICKQKAPSVYRRLAASMACLLALCSLLSGVAILKSGWDHDDFRDSKIQLKPKKKLMTPAIDKSKQVSRRSVVSE